jgi:excisionase family DNA binding protein
MTTPAGDWINLSEAAHILGVHPATVRNWSDKGRLPVYRTSGGHRRYKRSEVELWAQSARQESKASPQNSMQRLRDPGADWRGNEAGTVSELTRLPAQYCRAAALEPAGILPAVSWPRLVPRPYEHASRSAARVSAGDAVQAFPFFKNALVEGMMRGIRRRAVPPRCLGAASQVTAFMTRSPRSSAATGR